MATRCRFCPAPIFWRKHVRTGKTAPLDLEPSESGDCVLVEPDGYRVLFPDEVQRLRDAGAELYTRHFMTCPNREEAHRAKAAKTPGEISAPGESR